MDRSPSPGNKELNAETSIAVCIPSNFADTIESTNDVIMGTFGSVIHTCEVVVTPLTIRHVERLPGGSKSVVGWFPCGFKLIPLGLICNESTQAVGGYIGINALV